MKTFIKEYLIKNFIKENKRTPSQVELNFLYEYFLKENPLVEEEGLLANEKDSYCQANSVSSVSKYNKIWDKCFADVDFLIKEFEHLKKVQRNIYIDRLRNLKSFKKEYTGLEKKVNFSILNYQNQDIFSYEILEEFKDLSKVDIERSNIYHLDNEKITISVNKTEAFSVQPNEISFSLRHRKGTKKFEKILGNINNILKEDSSYFRIESISNIPDDIVEFSINLTFEVEKDINEIKYITIAEESNSKLMEDCYYSLNGSDFIHIDEYGASRRVSEDRNYLTFNNVDSEVDQKIKKIKLVLRKTNYDYESDGDYYYNFGIDFIGYLNRRFNLKESSYMYAGPYEVLDEEGNPYNFTMAKIDKGTCCEIPGLTSLDIYLSKDNINFIKADFNKVENNIVQFGNNWGNVKDFEHFDIINLENESDFLLDENLDFLNISEEQAAFNVYLNEANKDKVNLKSLKIKRNILNKKRNSAQEGLYSGWIHENGRYSCNFKCTIPEGRILDFGNTDTVLLNNSVVSGKTFIKYGNHTISVDAKFFNSRINETGIRSVRELRRETVNYPYDHRFMIEGFNYGPRFKGEKIYTGFSDQRGCDLLESSLSELMNDSNNVRNFSTITHNSNVYFVINRIDSIGIQEEYDITYRKNLLENGNLLFIKAILKTKEPKRAPNIDKIQVRVL